MLFNESYLQTIKLIQKRLKPIDYKERYLFTVYYLVIKIN